MSNKMLLVGSDPEMFIGRKGIPVSAIGKIGGTKEKPRPIGELGKGFAVQEDNVLLEYNTPPVRSSTAWELCHLNMRKYLTEMLKAKDLEILPDASYSMPESELQTHEAWIFGCDPDFNVWTGRMNPKPHAEDEKLRSAGGHIHVGMRSLGNTEKILLGRALDLYVGVGLSLVDPDKRRRELYGRAGAIRFKPYGLEYRTPSNWWAVNNRARWVYQQVTFAVRTVVGGKSVEKEQERILAAINEGDEQAATSLMGDWGIRLP